MKKRKDIILFEDRPWGKFETFITGEKYQVKRLTVLPGAKLSLQSHKYRSEHWVVVQGRANVINGRKRLSLKSNESIYIPARNVHRLENPGRKNLEVIEVQTGSYLGEDDIIRYKDIYNRIK